MTRDRGRLRRVAPVLGILVLSVLPFLAALDFGLVWDDTLLLKQVARVAGSHGAAALFASDFRLYTDQPIGYYRPLVTSSLWLQIGNAWRPGDDNAEKNAARSLHIFNLLVHAGCSVFLLLVLNILVGSGWAAWLGAALFAVHPVHVEPVVFISARTDSMAALNVLGSLLCWLKGGRAMGRSRVAWFVAGSTLAVMAALSKEAALLLPAVLIAWSLLLEDRNNGWWSGNRDWLALWILAAVAALLLRWQLADVGFGPEATRQHTGSIAWFLRLGVPAVLLYLKLWFLPWPLNSYYTAGQVQVTWPGVAAAIGIILLAGLVHRRGRGRLALAVLAFTFLFLMPVLHLVPLQGAVAAERFLYLPSAGLAMLFAAAALSLERERASRLGARAVLLAAVAAGVLLSARGAQPWGSDATLFARMVETSPEAAVAHFGLGGIMRDAGRFEEAAREYREAVRLRPDYVDAYIELGVANATLRDFAGAREALETARELDPGKARIYANLGALAVNQGQLEQAVSLLRRAVELEPNSPQMRYNLGLVLGRLGDDEGARREIDQLERLDPETARRLREELGR
jgi:tetratricopeptide (TPR) repeat protein